MGAPVMLPSSRSTQIETIYRAGVPYERVFCASCSKAGPLVVSPPEERRFVFYLHPDCADKYGKIDGLYLVPDEEYEKAMQAEIIEKHGRPLADHELVEVLNDPHSTLAKLAKERPY